MPDATSSFRWPSGHRAALAVVVHVAGVGLDTETPPQPRLTGVDYTTTGLQRLLDMLGDLDITATIAFTTDAVTGSPQLIHRAAELGHEVAASAVSPAGMGAETRETIERLAGGPVTGLIERLPGLPPSAMPDGVLAGGPNAWRMTGAGGDLPVSLRDPDATLIPASPYLIDTAWLAPDRPLPPSSLLEAWSLALAAHRTDETLMTVVLHPHISGRPGIAGTITRFLDEAIAAGDVWIGRLDHIARAWRELAPMEHE